MKENITLMGGLRRLLWLPIVTGIISIVLGVWCLCSPVESMELFAYIFAGCLCVAGVLNLCLALGNKSVGFSWGWALAMGILELICGIWLLALPAPVLAASFMFFVGIWIIVAAINSLCESFMLASMSAGWTVFSVLLLIATIIMAVVFLSSPIAGGVFVGMCIGLSLIFFGVYRLVVAASMRRATRGME